MKSRLLLFAYFLLLRIPSFFRLNRKYLSHIHAIEEVLSYSNSWLKVKLSNCSDSDILVSREKVSELKNWMDQ